MSKNESIFDTLKRTENSFSLMLLRFFIGWIFFKEGSGKIFGFFDHGGLDATSNFFRDVGIPYAEFFASAVGNLEMICGILILLGLFIRIATIPLLITIFVAIYTVHKNVGFHYPVLIYISLIILLQHGPGALSLDNLRKKKN